jgi:hypothetical protein
LALDVELQQILYAAQELATTGTIPDVLRDRIVGQPAPRGDTPEARLRRWITLFEDDVDKVHDVRSRVIHGILVPDADVKGAVWLGSHIIELLVGDRRVA